MQQRYCQEQHRQRCKTAQCGHKNSGSGIVLIQLILIGHHDAGRHGRCSHNQHQNNGLCLRQKPGCRDKYNQGHNQQLGQQDNQCSLQRCAAALLQEADTAADVDKPQCITDTANITAQRENRDRQTDFQRIQDQHAHDSNDNGIQQAAEEKLGQGLISAADSMGKECDAQCPYDNGIYSRADGHVLLGVGTGVHSHHHRNDDKSITTETPVPGCATGASHFADVEEASRFMLEVAKSFGRGEVSFYNEEEFARLQKLYGSMVQLQTLGKE